MGIPMYGNSEKPSASGTVSASNAETDAPQYSTTTSAPTASAQALDSNVLNPDNSKEAIGEDARIPLGEREVDKEIDREEAIKLYEERMEEEYAKREGGA
ncbi:hypothetical protein BJ508DRAFT_357338 [Ascobolus immersus RN42]|uniref:Uncharacterized protein n=1 Tax=Ascobolus immersus RN42 TaxID=1160509 RepID=A0A3N4IU17_ASCIM|nr:hypothetical protein BJ508DRAFT_357338 [Ascobolus immersus RN42]